MAGALATLAVAGSLVQGQAQVYTIADGSSQITFSTATGLTAWNIDGVNQLAQQSYWFRTGAGGESAISSLGTPFISQAYGANGRQLTAVYSNAAFGVQLNFSLANRSLTEQISVRNFSSNSLSFHFFRYADLDLGGVAGGQSDQILPGPVGGFNRAVQSIPGTAHTNSLTLTVPATFAEANYYANTLNSLQDGGPTSFLGSPTTAGLGDVTYAFQWDFNIAAGSSSQIISVLQNIQVPEPSAMALAGVAAALWLGSRRRQKESA